MDSAWAFFSIEFQILGGNLRTMAPMLLAAV